MAPHRHASRVHAVAFLAILGASLLVSLTPTASAQITGYSDGFEDLPPFLAPDGDFYNPTGSTGNFFVLEDPAQARTGNKSVKQSGSAEGRFIFQSPLATCGATGGSLTVYVKVLAYGSADTILGFLDSGPGRGAWFRWTSAGVLTGNSNGDGTPQPSAVLGTMPLDTWVDLHISLSNCAGAAATFASSHLGFAVLVDDGGSWTSGQLDRWRVLTAVSTTDLRLDDMSLQLNGVITPITPIESNQVAVTNLVGYSMDSTGRNIVVRTNGGTTIEAYSAVSLIQSGTASTPNCNRLDGVLTETLKNEIYALYVDCHASGDSSTFSLRSSSLGPPNFLPGEFGGSCSQQEADAVNSGSIDIPNALGEIGMVLSMPINYNRCSDAGINYAAAAWTFTEMNGRIGIFGALYTTGGFDFDDKADYHLDTSPSPFVNQFCSWRNWANGFDYIAGVTDAGPTAVLRATTKLNAPAGVISGIDVDLVGPVFLNSGTYGNAIGLACWNGSLAVLKETSVQVVNGITNGSLTPGPIKTVTSPQQRGIAVSGSGRFMAYTTGSNIQVAWTHNGTVTGTFAKPTGTFRGMEFDNSGEKLAVFTSTLITVYDTAPITCELSNTCAQEGGVAVDENPKGSSDTTTTTTTVPANSLFAPFVAAFGEMLGSTIGGQLATTVIIMFACAAFLGGRFGTFGVILGLAIGLAMAISGMVLPIEYALTTVLLLAIGTVLAFMYGGRLVGGSHE